MNSSNPNPLEIVPETPPERGRDAALKSLTRTRKRQFIAAATILTLAFALPLWRLIPLALNSEVQSHILLIPFIFGYLLKVAPKTTIAPARSWTGAIAATLIGLVSLASYLVFSDTARLAHGDLLSISTFAYLSCLLSVALFTLGWPVLRPHRFAIGFLVFLIPLPLAAIEFLSILLQLASAEVAAYTLAFTQMPVLRDGLVFQLPGLAIQVAEECSGIRSTLILFITSLLAGHLFLHTGWKKALLALIIFPLGIARNAFRITVISWLTVNVDRRIIDSAFHHQGGLLFFILSLIPLFVLLWMLRRSDLRRGYLARRPAVPGDACG